MKHYEQEQAELLDRYWSALGHDQERVHPADLAPDLAAFAQQLLTHRPAGPSQNFAERLRQDLAQQAQAAQPPRLSHDPVVPRSRLRHSVRWLAGAWRPSFAAVALLTLILVGVFGWMLRPPAANAQQILARAQQTATDSAGSDFQRFVMTQHVTIAPVNQTADTPSTDVTRFELHIWHEAPNRWRFEQRFMSPSSLADGASRLTIADGQNIWSVEGQPSRVQITSGVFGGEGKGGYPLFGAQDLDTFVRRAQTCADPSVDGEAIIAGRPAYVITLNATQCVAPASGEPDTLWIDKETFVVLKSILHIPNRAPRVRTMEVTHIAYNPALDPSLFSYTPPPESTVLDQSQPPARTPLPSETPPPPTAMPGPPQPTPVQTAGGGTVTDGPFTFDLRLYHDPILSPDTTLGPWAYSDLPGIGVYADWGYHGPPLQGPITWRCGIEPQLSTVCGGAYRQLQSGDHAGRTGGGVSLPTDIPLQDRIGDTVRWTMQIDTPEGAYGAMLRFTLRQGPNGLEPTDITVELVADQ
jgi:outer membrane lipoprotein-sorting protein